MPMKLSKSRQPEYWGLLRDLFAFQFSSHFFLFISTSLATAVSIPSRAAVHDIEVRKRDASPEPVSLGPSQAWKGSDGPWASFVLQIGTPSQKIDVDISIGGQETWVIVDEGCPEDNPNGDQCGDLRGGIFNASASTTWESATETWNNSGIYPLGGQVDDYLGLTARGRYGFDTVGIPFNDGTKLPVNHSVIAGIAATKFFIGQLGVSPLATNFTGDDGGSVPRPSFLTLLKENGKIPSLSFSFNAGSYARSTTVRNAFGSLIFGGYDASLAGPDSQSFDFGSDNGRELMVGIQAITKHTEDNETNLLPTPLLAALDSSQPNLWLPESACELFESAFGLEWNETDQLYKVNETLHDKLVKENANVTFRLGREVSGGDAVEIVLPYGAFDLTGSWPVVSDGDSAYFPLKRAANSTQYTLGRSFMQEAYLIADWERRNFSLSQRSWNSSASQNIVSIRPLDNTTNSSGDSSLSGGAIAGIVIGCVAFAIIVAGVLAMIRRRKSKARNLRTSGEEPATAEKGAELEGHQSMTNEVDGHNQVKHELEGSREPCLEMDGDNQLKHELHGDVEHQDVKDNTAKPAELAGDTSDVHIHELAGNEPNLELAGDEPNLKEQQSAKH